MDGGGTTELLAGGKSALAADTLEIVDSTRDEEALSTEKLLKGPIDELVRFSRRGSLPEDTDLEIGLENLKIEPPTFHPPLQPDHAFEKRQVDYMMQKLYNIIQVYLIRNNFSLTFLKRFKRYIDYLIEFNMDPMLDENVIVLQEELLHKNILQHNTKFEDILKRFLFKPNNVILNLVVYEFNQQNKLLKTFFLNWRIHLTNMKLLHMYEIFIKHKYLKIWHALWQNYRKNLWEKSLMANEIRLKEFGLDAFLNKYDSKLKLDALADTKFKQSIFQRMKRKQKIVKENLVIFHKRQSNLLRIKYWKKMCLQYKLANFKFNSIKLKEKYFLKILTKYQYNRDLYDKSIQSQKLFTLRPFLNKWLSQLQFKQAVNDDLDFIERRFILTKFLNIWHQSFQLKLQENLLYCRLDLTLCENILKNIWHKRFRERLHLYSIQNIKDEKLKGKTFHRMLNRYQDTMKSEFFLHTNSLRKFWKIWKLNYKFKQHRMKNETTIKSKIIAQWKHIHELNNKLNQYNKERLIQKIINKWLIQTRRRTKSVQTAEVRYNKRIRKFLFTLWLTNTTNIKHLDPYCDKYIQRKFIKLIKQRSNRIILLQDGYMQQLNGLNRLLQRQILLSWYEKYLDSKQFELEKRLRYYQEDYALRTSLKYLQIWQDRLELIQVDYAQIAIEYNKKKIKTKLFLTLWNKLNSLQMENNYVDTIYHDTLKKRIFQNWKYKKDTLSQWQFEVLQEYELKLLSAMLNKWSMSHLKIKRNERTVIMFRQRWDRANLRGILNLWHGKLTLSKQDLFNTSGVKGSLFTPAHKSTHTANSNVLGSNFTDGAKFSSLRGTVELKKQRMQEMRNRYNSARLIPSPIKDSNIFDTTTKRQLDKKTKNIDNDGPRNSYVSRSPHRVSPIKLNFGTVQRLQPTAHNNSSATLTGSPIKRPSL